MTADRVAYVMNGFPRLSETFIAHEIHQLERLGMDLRLFSVKRENEPHVHPVVAAIRAPLTYLPRASSLSGTHADGLAGATTCPPSAARTCAWHCATRCAGPARWAGARAGLAPPRRDAQGRLRLRKVFIKEFLQAGESPTA
jgi:hypothetical protein